jgi:hypothetical protein
MIEIRILKIDERINDSSNITKLPISFNGQVIRRHDPAHNIYIIAGNIHDVPQNQIEGLPARDPLGRCTRW